MERVFDKIILLIFSFLVLFESEHVTQSVIILLIALCFTGIEEVITSTKFSMILDIFLLLISLFFPSLICICSLAFYDIGYRTKNYYFLFSIPVILYTCSISDIYSAFYLSIIASSYLLAYYLSYKTVSKKQLETEMNHIRDTGMELNLKLSKQNKMIIEQQDYEVHLATLTERNRIAREIHDNVGHMLSRTILQVGALMVVHKGEAVCEQLKSIHDTLDQAMTSIRESVHDLHDDSIDLRMVIRESIKDIESKYKITVDYDISQNVPKEIKYAMISIIKEGLSNIVKHSNGTSIHIVLREHPGFFQLSIQDNGTTALSQQNQTDYYAHSSGIGLTNMKERAEALNGTFRINTENGFQIFVSIPRS